MLSAILRFHAPAPTLSISDTIWQTKHVPLGDWQAAQSLSIKTALDALAKSQGYANMEDWMAKVPPVLGDPDYDPGYRLSQERAPDYWLP